VPGIDTTKRDHERSLSEEESDIVTEIVSSTCNSRAFIYIFRSSPPGYSATISKATNADTPSKSAKSTGYQMYQRNLPIYDGRYDVNCPISTTAPPVQLFHPVFGHFLDDMQTGNWIFRRKHYRLLLVLWQVHLAYMRRKTTENRLSSLILLRLSPWDDEDRQSRSDFSRWCHIVASNG
jgi:hypothetical protein